MGILAEKGNAAMDDKDLKSILHKTFIEIYSDLEELADIAKKGSRQWKNMLKRLNRGANKIFWRLRSR